MCMILSKEDTIYVSKLVVDYFSKFGRIDDYFRERIERVKKICDTPFWHVG